MATTIIPKLLGNFETSLASKISSSAAAMTLNRSTDDDGNTLSGLYQVTLDEGTTSEEHMYVTFTGASGAISRRGLSRVDFWTEQAANKFEHNRGASVKVTNFSLGLITRLLNGTDTFNAVDWSGVNSITGLVAPVNGSDATNKDYADALVGGPGYFNRLVVGGNAGEAVVDGDLLFLLEGDNEWYQADADTASEVEGVLLGIAQGAGSDGAAITGGVLLRGLDDAQAGLTPGDTYYASNTPGDISAATGTTRRAIGIAATATTLIFDPNIENLPTYAQKALLAGITASAAELNNLDGYTGDVNDLNEMATFFGATDISGAEAETLTDGSNADSLHVHTLRAITVGQTSRAINSTGAQTIAHGLGKTPTYIQIYASTLSDTGVQSNSFGTATSAANESCSYMTTGAIGGQDASHIIFLGIAGGNGASATVTGLDATNITLNWDANTNTGGARYVQWIAFG